MNMTHTSASRADMLHKYGYAFDSVRRLWQRPGATAFGYSDGDAVENRLWEAIRSSADISLFSSELRRHQTDWPSIYHLSAARANLLRPLGGLIAGAQVLEIGAGCGAVTRYLGEQGAEVLALEGSCRRAAIAAERCRDLDNVALLCDRFQDFETSTRYDIVTLVGVLEYARIFSDDSTEDAVHALLVKARALLKENGVLLVAIENQLGLKYFAGAREDHLGRAMSGIQDHYCSDSVVTFGRHELERRVLGAGFEFVEIALPFPDYKLPQSVILPDGYAVDSGFDAASLAGQAAGSDRQLQHCLFAMEPAFAVIGRNRLLADLSNSFLLLAGASTASPGFASAAPDTLAEHFSVERPAAYTKATRFVRKEGQIRASRRLLCPDAPRPPAMHIEHACSDEDYFQGVNAGDQLKLIVSRRGWSVDDLVPWFLEWKSALARDAGLELATMDIASDVSGALFDAMPRNLVAQEHPRFFDLEWRARTPLEFGFLAFRAVRTSFEHATMIAEPAEEVLRHLPSLIRILLRRCGILVTGNDIQRYFDLEASFQDEILGLARKAPATTTLDIMELEITPDIDTWLADVTALQASQRDLLAREQAAADVRESLERDVMEARAQERQLAESLNDARSTIHATQAQLTTAIAELENERGRGQALEDKLSIAELETVNARGEITQLEATITRLESKIAHLESSIRDLESTPLQFELTISQLESAISRLGSANSHLESELEAKSIAVSDLESRLAVASHAERLAQQRADEIALITGSRSWALTAPLRGTMRLIRVTAARGRVTVLRMAERIYRQLPAPQSTKQGAKAWLFRTFPGTFGSTNAYRRWRSYEAAIALARPYPAPPQIAAQQDAAGESAQVECRLLQADGHWEWAEYPRLRERINASMSVEHLRKTFTPRGMIDFSSQDPHLAASRIVIPDAPARPVVTILIPVYNHLRLTLECLASIAAASSKATPSFEIVIANDASSDDSKSVLSSIPNVRVVDQPENLGFLRNCNAAARHARGRYLLLLNNDVQVTAGWLERMVGCIERHESVGAVGPRIVYPNGALQEAGTALRRDGTAEMIGLNDAPDSPCYAFDREVDYCSGACLLMRLSDFEALGGFDERYAPAYCEDSDLCMRLRERGKRIVYCGSAEVVHHLSATSSSLDNDYKLACIARNLQTFTSTWQERLDRINEIRTIAFYLPQFHPIPENDLWWGRGFTEWTNVTKAKPNFVGHYQPRVPADLGYYDLRVVDIMRQQAALARRYGITGFCFYYYWFAGKRLLERPIEQFLADDGNDMPFCLCWANENWTRRWDGQEQEVLIAQHHSPDDDEAVIRDLIRYFRKGSYIRIDGRPLLLIYRANLFPDFAATAARWRAICREAGIGEIYLAHVESFELTLAGVKPDHFGCDAAVEFPPHGMAQTYAPRTPLLNPDFTGLAADYRDLATRFSTRPLPDYKRFLGVMPGWDNTARRQNNSYVFEASTPGAFQAWLETTLARTHRHHCGEERIVFINAWNEWAEGAYLEPDRRFGHAFLEAVMNARDNATLMRHAAYSLGD
jgi:GT2 family glycosyltransferase/2-polyprenyl-3-methyl-5-hydroxy-6-metoxy-1,4-benzoquinol methylase